MVGPSASGSENGTPTSTKSAPAASTSRKASSDSAGVGKPAVRYGISPARRPCPAPARMARQRAAMGWSDKVVADVDAVFRGVGDLDDGPREVPLPIALREIGEGPRVLDRALGRRDDADHGTVHLADIGVRAVHDPHLE